MHEYYDDTYHVLPCYTLELKDENGKQLIDKNLEELFKTTSRSNAERMFSSMLFNQGCTLTLKKIEDGAVEIIAQRTE